MKSPQACERKIGSDKKAQHQSTNKRSASQIGGRFLQRTTTLWQHPLRLQQRSNKW